jgi:hypothetical protein
MVPVPIGVDASDAVYQAEDVGRDAMWAVNINHIICPGAPLCRPILGGHVVWRDYNHLTPQVLTHFRARIWHLMPPAAPSTASASPAPASPHGPWYILAGGLTTEGDPPAGCSDPLPP